MDGLHPNLNLFPSPLERLFFFQKTQKLPQEKFLPSTVSAVKLQNAHEKKKNKKRCWRHDSRHVNLKGAVLRAAVLLYPEEVVDVQSGVDEQDGVLGPLQTTDLTPQLQTLGCVAVLNKQMQSNKNRR